MSKISKKNSILITIIISIIVTALIISSNLVFDLKTKYLIILHLFLLALFANIIFFFKWRSNLVYEKDKNALKESENKYRTLIESLIEGIGIVDENENFTFANKAGNEIFGCNNGELVGKNLIEFTTEKSFNSALEKTENKKLGNTDIYELNIIGLDNLERTILVKTSPVIDKDGKYKGAFGFFTDVTEQKKYEKKRDKIIRELENTVSDSKYIANGFLPICASCYDIRDRDNVWNPIVNYLSEHTNIKFTHSICPECRDEIYGFRNDGLRQKREYEVED
ncbi:MAG: PAS domain S-box protein [Candidatus Izemoplasma sp.]